MNKPLLPTLLLPALLAGCGSTVVPFDDDGPGPAPVSSPLFARTNVAGVTDVAQSTQGAAIADFNGDDHLDLLLVHSSKIRLLLGTSEPLVFTPGTFAVDGETPPGSNYAPTVVDLNDDGKLDVFIGSSDQNNPKVIGEARLLMSQPGGGYKHVARSLKVANPGAYNHGRIDVGDINGDGKLDLGVGANQIAGTGQGRPLRRVYVWNLNDNASPHYGDLSSQPDALPGFSQSGEQCDAQVDRACPMTIFRDLDDDGDLDILQGCSNDMYGKNNSGPISPSDQKCVAGGFEYGTYAWRNQLNEGLAKFEKLTEQPGSIVDIGRMRYDAAKGHYVATEEDGGAFGGLGMNTADVDNDGDLDVIGTTPTDPEWHVQSSMRAVEFWYNEGDFKFRKATADAGLDVLNNSYSYWSQLHGVTFPKTLDPNPCPTVNFQHALCKDLAPADHQIMAGGGSVFADFDNDGWLDLLVIDRHELPGAYHAVRNLVLMNRGDGTFKPLGGNDSGIDVNSISAAARDLNGDGLIDLFMPASPGNSGGSGAAKERSQDKVFINQGQFGGQDNHWVELRLSGLLASELIGARIFAYEAGSSRLLGRRDYFPTGGSYKTSQDLHAHFGLGQTDRIDIKVILPGVEQTTVLIEDVPIDARITIDVVDKTTSVRP